MTAQYFNRSLFRFLDELEKNNTREWFLANKDRYVEVVQEPLLGFIAAFSRPLSGISPHFLADPRPQGGSMFRIYRDVRFSRDKSPYKTHAAAQFRHRAGRDVHAPGFYLHLEPGSVFAGAGIWHPDGATLRAIREMIVDQPEAWRRITADPDMLAHHRLGGDSLKRAPRGFDPDHPLIDDIKRKDFVCSTQLSESEILSPGFLDRFTEVCRAASPLVRFLCKAIEVPF